MFERFTEKGIKSIMLAQQEARRLGHNFVGTEQILLGIIGEGTGIGSKALVATGVTLDDARREVQRIIGRGSGFVAIEIPFTPRAKRVLEIAWDESRKLGTDYIGTEHLLLGLLREGEGVAARALENLDVNLEQLRAEILKLLPGSKGEKPGTISTKPSIPTVTKQQTYSVARMSRVDQFLDLPKISNLLIEPLINMLSVDGQALVEQLREVLRNKELALRSQDYEKAASLLNEQMDITEKLRKTIGVGECLKDLPKRQSR